MRVKDFSLKDFRRYFNIVLQGLAIGVKEFRVRCFGALGSIESRAVC